LDESLNFAVNLSRMVHAEVTASEQDSQSVYARPDHGLSAGTHRRRQRPVIDEPVEFGDEYVVGVRSDRRQWRAAAALAEGQTGNRGVFQCPSDVALAECNHPRLAAGSSVYRRGQALG
jgi:hypothetical protein